MIETSALPAIAKLLGAAAPSGETGEASPISAQFAQLLSMRLGAAPAGGDRPADAGTPVPADPRPATGKHRGKPGGKPLPELPPAAVGLSQSPELPAEPVADAKLPDNPVASVQIAPSEVPAVGIAIVASPLPVTAEPDAGPSGQSEARAAWKAKALPAMPDALRLPASGGLALAPRPAAPFANGGPPTNRGQTGLATLPVAPQPAIQKIRLVALDLDAPEAAPPPNAVPVRLVAPMADTGEFNLVPDIAGPLSAAEPVASAEPAGIALPVSRATQLAASLRQLLTRFERDAPEAGGSGPRPPVLAPVEPEAAPPASIRTGPEPLAPSAPEIASAATPSPAATAPALAPSSSALEPRDFAQLIDRLVEAREAVRSAQAPHTVDAAIAHAEFGKVSLRFEQDGGALSVSLASPDPDFARAVQAAAPAAQQGPSQDNAATPQRQADAGQQSPGTGAGQPQSQQRGQTASQPMAEPRDRPAPQSRHDGEARPPRRNGIFA